MADNPWTAKAKKQNPWKAKLAASKATSPSTSVAADSSSRPSSPSRRTSAGSSKKRLAIRRAGRTSPGESSTRLDFLLTTGYVTRRMGTRWVICDRFSNPVDGEKTYKDDGPAQKRADELNREVYEAIQKELA